MANRTGSVLSSDPRAAQQAASIGATIGPDGWWYLNGQRLTPQQADEMVNAAGAGISGLSDEGHGEPGGFRIGGDVGGLWERNKNDIAKYGGIAANFIPGVGPLAAAGIGAGLNYGANHDIGGALKGGAMSYIGGKLAGGIGGGGTKAATTTNPSVWDKIVDKGGDFLGGLMPGGGKDGKGGLTWADILKTGGAVASGYADNANSSANRDMQKDQFRQNLEQRQKEFGITSGQRNSEFATNTLPGIQRRLDMNPLVDKGAYMMNNRAAPTAFKPRDFTQTGMIQPNAQASGGPTQQVAANAQAAANYRPGAGGVDSATLEFLKQKMMQQARA